MSELLIEVLGLGCAVDDNAVVSAMLWERSVCAGDGARRAVLVFGFSCGGGARDLVE